MDIYDRIDACLEKQNKTKVDLCKSIGLSYNTLMSCYRRRSKKMPIETIRDMAQYFGVTLDFLISGDDNSSHNSNNVTAHNGSPIINNISNHNVHTVTVSNGVDKKWNLSEIEYEVLNVMNRLSTKDKNELLNTAYQLEKNKKENN